MDASIDKWGVLFQGRSRQGRWQRLDHHINGLELRTVLIAIQPLPIPTQGEVCVVSHRQDNSSLLSQ